MPSSWGGSSNQTTLFCLPFLDLSFHPLDNVRLCAGLSKGINEMSVRIHEIKEYGVVDQVVVTRFGIWRRREVHAVGFAGRFGRRVVAYQSDKTGVEVAHVTGHLRERVACWID